MSISSIHIYLYVSTLEGKLTKRFWCCFHWSSILWEKKTALQTVKMFSYVWLDYAWHFVLFLLRTKEAKCGYGLGIMAIYWITEALPLSATALLPLVIFPMLGLISVEEVCSSFIRVSWKLDIIICKASGLTVINWNWKGYNLSYLNPKRVHIMSLQWNVHSW